MLWLPERNVCRDCDYYSIDRIETCEMRSTEGILLSYQNCKVSCKCFSKHFKPFTVALDLTLHNTPHSPCRVDLIKIVSWLRVKEREKKEWNDKLVVSLGLLCKCFPPRFFLSRCCYFYFLTFHDNLLVDTVTSKCSLPTGSNSKNLCRWNHVFFCQTVLFFSSASTYLWYSGDTDLTRIFYQWQFSTISTNSYCTHSMRPPLPPKLNFTNI